MCAANFSKKSNLDYSGIFLPTFPSTTNLKLYNIHVTPKLVKKIITNLDSSKASGPDFIPMLVVKSCEPVGPHILAELFNICLQESCFPDCWKVSSVVTVSLLSVVSKIFEKLVNNRHVDHIEKCGLFSDFQYGFRSSRLSASFVSDRITRAFSGCGATYAVVLGTSKAFESVGHLCLLHKVKSSQGIPSQVISPILSFLSNRHLGVVLDVESS